MISISWSLQRADHGEQTYWMAITLAAMLGQIGLPGGGFGGGYGPVNLMGSAHPKYSGPTLPQGKNEIIVFDEDMPGFGLRLRAGGSAVWVAQYRVGAKQHCVHILGALLEQHRHPRLGVFESPAQQ